MKNTRILVSALTIVAVVAGVSAVTYAFFSDSGTSNDNVFASGTIDLKLSDSNETVQDSVVATIGGTNMVPGDTQSGTLQLRNSGSHVADHAELQVINTNTDLVNPLDTVMQITALTYDSVSVMPQLSDLNLNGYVDLDDLEAIGLDNLALTDLGVDHPLAMTVQFRSDAGNAYQGDSVDSDWTVTLNQDLSQ
jgi:predicted ribosomally synthesized peptide with SipW-like signal peptide